MGRRCEYDQYQIAGNDVVRAWGALKDCADKGYNSQGDPDSTPGDHPGRPQGLAGVVKGCVDFAKG